MDSKIGIGVVGAGYWGTKLVGEYVAAQKRGLIKTVKVCDSSMSALVANQERFSIFDDLVTRKVQNLIDDPQVSALHIATPNRTHYLLARKALEAGKDVLVEKPMTLKSLEAFELVDIAASSDRVLQVGHIFRFNNALHEACRLLRSGAIGDVRYARVQWTDYAPIFPDRDIIFDLGPHPIDVLNQLLDAWPIQVGGFARAYRNSKEHPEVAYGIADFPDDVFAHIELSWLHPGKVRQASVMGEAGMLIVDCAGQRVFKGDLKTTEEIPVSPSNTIEAEIEHFVDCVTNRIVSSESAVIGARTVEVLEKMTQSMWERPLPVIEPFISNSEEIPTATADHARQIQYRAASAPNTRRADV